MKYFLIALSILLTVFVYFFSLENKDPTALGIIAGCFAISFAIYSKK